MPRIFSLMYENVNLLFLIKFYKEKCFHVKVSSCAHYCSFGRVCVYGEYMGSCVHDFFIIQYFNIFLKFFLHNLFFCMMQYFRFFFLFSL